MPESDTLAVHMDVSQEAREHSEYFDELTEAERIEKVLAHHGVKGMKWGVRNSEDRVTKAKNTTTKAPVAGVGTQSTSSKSGGGGAGGASAKEDEADTKGSEVDKDADLPPGYTRKEFNAQRKMIDDFLASKGKGGGSGSDKAAGGKKKGGGGGGKKKGGSKGKKKSGKSDSSTPAKSSTSNAASAVAKTSFKSSYPARKAITSILNRAPVLPKTISSGAQAIIDEINASVDARIKVAKTNSGLTHNDESTERIWTMTQKNTMILDDDPQEVARIQANGAEALKHMFESGDEEVLESLEGVLAHYGVLGMKWGVRKDRGGGGRPQGPASRQKAPLSSVKRMIKPAKKSNQEIEDKFYKRHKANPTVMPMRDGASGKTVPVRYDGNILNREQDRQNQPVFSAKRGVPEVVAKKELAYVTKQLSEARNILNGTVESANNSTPVKGMSDDDLRMAISRMQMEKTYKQLVAEQTPAPVEKQKSVIGKIVTDSAKQSMGQILTKTATTVGTYAIAAALAGTNPAMANALMKGVGDNAVKKAEAAKTDANKADEPDATVNSNQNGSKKSPDLAKQTVNTAMAANKASAQKLANVRDEASNAAKAVSAAIASASKAPASNYTSSNTTSTRTLNKWESMLDLGPAPEEDWTQRRRMEVAMQNAAENYLPNQILEELYKVRRS